MDRPLDLHVTIGAEGAVLVVRLRGELDLATAPFARSVVDCVFSDPPRHLVLDLSGLRFLNSSGLDVLAHCRDLGRRHGCEVVMRGATGIVARLLELVPDREPVTQ